MMRPRWIVVREDVATREVETMRRRVGDLA
jgi:hypothetical protein